MTTPTPLGAFRTSNVTLAQNVILAGKALGKVSRGILSKGGGRSLTNFLSPFHKCIFGQYKESISLQNQQFFLMRPPLKWEEVYCVLLSRKSVDV